MSCQVPFSCCGTKRWNLAEPYPSGTDDAEVAEDSRDVVEVRGAVAVGVSLAGGERGKYEVTTE